MKSILIYFVNIAAKIFTWAVWGYVILSWFARASETTWKIYSFLSEIVEPLLAPFRKLLRPITMRIGLDFSPYILALVISAVSSAITRALLTIL